MSSELIKEYEKHVPVKDLAKQFGIHRLTVRPYSDAMGWSCANSVWHQRTSL